MSTMGTADVAELQTELAYCTGTEQWYRHLCGMLYTDGVKLIAERCGAYWLIDLVCSHQLNRKVRKEDFQVWELDCPRGARKQCVASCWPDTPHKSKVVAIQRFEYSDFPKELCPFKLYVEGNVILLPSEH